MDYIYLSRPLLHTLSASKFIESIMKIKHKEKLDKRDYKRLRYYMPEKLSDKGVKYIVKQLRRCDLK